MYTFLLQKSVHQFNIYNVDIHVHVHVHQLPMQTVTLDHFQDNNKKKLFLTKRIYRTITYSILLSNCSEYCPNLTVQIIECVHLTSSNSQIQNKRATKGFILIRHKRYQIYTCLQLSSSIASFVWKPAHFELRSYGGA